MVAQVIRFWPEYVFLKDLYDRKELGKLKSIIMTRLSARPVWGWENWLQQPLKSGGALVDLHIHDTDYCLYLLGWPEKISSRGVKTKFGWDHIFSTFTYRGGAVATLEGGWDMPDKFPFTMAFIANFEKGTVEYNSRHNIFNIYKTTGEIESPKLGVEMEAKGTGGNISSLGGYFKEIEYFLEVCQGEKVPSIITPREPVESLRLALEEMKIAEKR
jgi:predicted dehydrogenase